MSPRATWFATLNLSRIPSTEFKYIGPGSIQSLSETPECVLKLELPQILNFVVTPAPPLRAYVSGI